MTGWLNDAARVIYDNKELVLIGLFFLLLIYISPRKDTGWEGIPPRGWKRRGKNMRRQRQLFVEDILTYDFVDRIETRISTGEITRSEGTEVYRKLKQLFPIRNLFPAPELLKARLLARQGTFTKPKIPGSNFEEKPRRKNMFEEFPERVVL